MKFIKYILTLSVFFIFTVNIHSQNKKIDSLKIELENNKAEDSIRVNLLIGLYYEIQDLEIEKARLLLNEAETISKKINYSTGKADVIYYKGHIDVKKSNYKESILKFKEAIKLYRSLNNSKGESYANNGIGMAYYYQSDFANAIVYYKKSAEIDESLNDLKGVAGSLNNMGNIYADQGNYVEAISNYTRSKELKLKVKDTMGVARAYTNIGSIFGEQGNYPRALENFNTAVDIYEKLGLSNHTAGLMLNIGMVYDNLGNVEKALIYVNKALEVSKKQNNQITIAICLSVKGSIYKTQLNYVNALEEFQKALQIRESINNKRGIGISLNDVADVQILVNQETKALKNFKKAEVVNQEIGSQIGLCRSYLGLARCFNSQKQYQKALNYVLKSQEIAVEMKLLELQKETAELLSIIYKNTGDYKKSLTNYQQYKILNDSIFNKENIEKITQLEYEYKYKQALDSASIRELKLTKTVLDTSQNLKKSQRNLFLGVVAFLIITLALGIIILLLKLRNEKSKTQNVIIEQKLLRSQMTPHFIFNSLSVLQGMILNKEQKKSVSYLSKFSKLLRTILENSRDRTVLLSQELIAVDNYLALQNLENESYAYTISVEDSIDTSSFKIPPMLIQPFVENAIEHAFVNQTGNKTINIKLTYSNEELICVIKDNGVGIDYLKEGKNQDKKSLSTTITSERLQILSKDFKKKGSVTVEDRKKYNEQGTIVTLTIPYIIIESSENINNRG
ncbi:tetratricopeptide repeat protein [Tenacibaculum discolor]|uniref:tetratricopeptide repeat protein n=1 Tax=Tenacibaculum discolor TaxID=361581 RepID=UPI000EAD648F|nr:tetratricopeptide repeat protein [Tenacibaculum discolor]RLK00441.1 tetratricopeptide repeat protein [Tenacibaculum discolor]